METLIVNYNTTLNKTFKEKNIKTIHRKFLLLDDLDIIDKYLDTNKYILLKNDKLNQRKDFDLNDFANRYIETNLDTDIFILSSYHEKCKDLIKKNDYDDYTFFKSKIPGEIEAFIIKSDKWQNIKNLLNNSKEEKINHKLKNLILNEELQAEFAWPQPYYFKDNYNLLEICRQEQESFISPRIKELSYYWFFVTFVFTIIFTYLIYDKIPKDRFFYLGNK